MGEEFSFVIEVRGAAREQQVLRFAKDDNTSD
jgi:hypothetical protein